MNTILALCTALVRLLRPTRGIHTTPSGYLRELGAELRRCRSGRVRRYVFDVPGVLVPDPDHRPSPATDLLSPRGSVRTPRACQHERVHGAGPDGPAEAGSVPGPRRGVPGPLVPAPRRPSGARSYATARAFGPDAPGGDTPDAPGKPAAFGARHTADEGAAPRTRHYDADDLVRSYLRAHERRSARRPGKLDRADVVHRTAQAWGCAV